MYISLAVFIASFLVVQGEYTHFMYMYTRSSSRYLPFSFLVQDSFFNRTVKNDFINLGLHGFNLICF